MKKIKKIEFVEDNKPIHSGFKIDNLEEIVVITGENNSGKTNFARGFKDVKAKFYDFDGNEIENLKTIFISAENIQPGESEAKPSEKNSGLYKNLSELFENLNIKLSISDHGDTKGVIETLFFILY